MISKNLFFQANEVLLFEKSTFLIIAHAQRADHRDVHRFEKISNIIKQFKLSCIKLAAQFTVSFFNFSKNKMYCAVHAHLLFLSALRTWVSIPESLIYNNSDFKNIQHLAFVEIVSWNTKLTWFNTYYIEYFWIVSTHSIWQIRPLFPRSK